MSPYEEQIGRIALCATVAESNIKKAIEAPSEQERLRFLLHGLLDVMYIKNNLTKYNPDIEPGQGGKLID